MTASAPARRGRRLALPAAMVIVAGIVVVSLFVGVYDLDSDALGAEMLWITRVPRTVALVLAGCAMSVAGLVIQLLTQNRFVEPTTTGTAEWAALGLLGTVLLLPGADVFTRMALASATAFGGTLVFLAILRRVVLRTSLVVPLIGIMLGAVVAAFTTYLAVSTNSLQMLGTWFMGSFTPIVRGRYEPLWVVAIVVVAVAVMANRLTAASLGKDVATSLGLDYDRVLLLGTALVACATGVTTVVVGFLPFLGLVVPNLVSMWRGDDLRANLPWVCLGGIAIIVVCDIVGRVVRMPFEVPVSMILGLLGSAVFICLLLRLRPHD
ncbi:MAG: iron chelate uptake ABC transporter family permease subunit [Chloroflexi bacterium]|nr:iron chelate uptake ABC transporter family permease subunit [Chloroflexota bacterium]